MCMLLVNVSAILIECICRNNPASLPAFTLTFLRVSVWRRVPHIQVFRFCRVYLLIFRDFYFYYCSADDSGQILEHEDFFCVCVFKFTVLFYLPVWAGSGQMSKSILRWPNLRFIGTKHFWYDFFFFFFWRFGTKLRNNSPLVHSYLKKNTPCICNNQGRKKEGVDLGVQLFFNNLWFYFFFFFF